MLSFEQARASVLQQVAAARAEPLRQTVPIEDALGRVLATPITADRDFPPTDRSLRDGFAVRAEDLPGELHISGEVRAGQRFTGLLQPGEALEIMTGAPIPPGADSVVMVEHAERRGSRVFIAAAPMPGQFISRRGEEAPRGRQLLERGALISYAEAALLAAAGCSQVPVYRIPTVAILPTGDELVPITDHPQDHQIRNSNPYSLRAQVIRAGGIPVVCPTAPDNKPALRESIEAALACDLVLLSGGVSAGKYDLVESVLADLEAEFFFDRAAIQPGQPVVFGRARGKFFFGLPGNPVSTMITFEIFARAALELLAGQAETPLPFALARLTEDFRQKPGLTRFLPARLSGPGDLTPISSKSSADVAALARANAFLVTDPARTDWRAGETISILLK